MTISYYTYRQTGQFQRRDFGEFTAQTEMQHPEPGKET